MKRIELNMKQIDALHTCTDMLSKAFNTKIAIIMLREDESIGMIKTSTFTHEQLQIVVGAICSQPAPFQRTDDGEMHDRRDKPVDPIIIADKAI